MSLSFQCVGLTPIFLDLSLSSVHSLMLLFFPKDYLFF